MGSKEGVTLRRLVIHLKMLINLLGGVTIIVCPRLEKIIKSKGGMRKE